MGNIVIFLISEKNRNFDLLRGIHDHIRVNQDINVHVGNSTDRGRRIEEVRG